MSQSWKNVTTSRIICHQLPSVSSPIVTLYNDFLILWIVPPIGSEYDFPNWKELGSTVMSLARTRFPGAELITSHECDVIEIPEQSLRLPVRPESMFYRFQHFPCTEIRV